MKVKFINTRKESLSIDLPSLKVSSDKVEYTHDLYYFEVHTSDGKLDKSKIRILPYLIIRNGKFIIELDVEGNSHDVYYDCEDTPIIDGFQYDEDQFLKSEITPEVLEFTIDSYPVDDCDGFTWKFEPHSYLESITESNLTIKISKPDFHNGRLIDDDYDSVILDFTELEDNCILHKYDGKVFIDLPELNNYLNNI